MSPRDLVYVGHMLDMARKAISKTQGLSRGAYDADEGHTVGEATPQIRHSIAKSESLTNRRDRRDAD